MVLCFVLVFIWIYRDSLFSVLLGWLSPLNSVWSPLWKTFAGSPWFRIKSELESVAFGTPHHLALGSFLYYRISLLLHPSPHPSGFNLPLLYKSSEDLDIFSIFPDKIPPSVPLFSPTFLLFTFKELAQVIGLGSFPWSCHGGWGRVARPGEGWRSPECTA